MAVLTSPFGSLTRTRVLLALRLLDQSYPRELARLLDVSLSTVQKAVRSLETDQLVAGRSVGRTRVFQLNPVYFARTEMEAFLARLVEADDALKERVGRLRRRPRRTGKRL